MPLCNQVEYAKRKGLSTGRINRLVKQGVFDEALRNIGRRKKPFIDSDVADAILDSKLQPSGPLDNEEKPELDISRVKQKGKVSEEERKEVIKAGKGGTLSYSDARTMHERYRAVLKKLQFEEKSGKLVSTEGVQRQAFTLGRQVRDAVLNVSDRIAPILATVKEEREIKRILDKELNSALEALSGGQNGSSSC